jgi:hypothetical protein
MLERLLASLSFLRSAPPEEAAAGERRLADSESAIPKTPKAISEFERILQDPSLAKGMFPPYYFLLVE